MGEEKKYKGKEKEVIGYGFTQAVLAFHYIFFEIKPRVESALYKRLIDGEKYTLYYLMKTAQARNRCKHLTRFYFNKRAGSIGKIWQLRSLWVEKKNAGNSR